MTHFGISLLRVSPGAWTEVAQEAERLGFESVWMSDHLVLPAEMDAADYPDGRLPIRPETPVFDSLVYLAAIAARTRTLRLGTYVYQLGLRHPLAVARAVATLDVVSAGRVELGIGAGWMPAEWAAAGMPQSVDGARPAARRRVLPVPSRPVRTEASPGSPAGARRRRVTARPAQGRPVRRRMDRDARYARLRRGAAGQPAQRRRPARPHPAADHHRRSPAGGGCGRRRLARLGGGPGHRDTLGAVPRRDPRDAPVRRAHPRETCGQLATVMVGAGHELEQYPTAIR
ncbi:Coenzyme F420-dependent N5 N10-methylene tetrahydromethanopterin reductase-like protein [Parafrankia sp. EAN1pec]|nr:Coenzyme F420-dependent N5 N10-methylene tetrahydromethanopterin reductase-like protein [Frankia sp. EAN1pec]